MKNILLPIFILLSLASFGQAPIALDTVNNACHIDKIGFAKDNMTYTLNGDSSINIFIVGAASYQNTHYSRFRDPGGNPFANRTELTNWLDLYFFANALADSSSTGGGDTATLESVTTGTGNNITPNALQVKDALNLNVDSQTTVVYNYGAAINGGGLAVTTNGSLRRIAEYSEDAGTTVIYNDPQSQSILLREQTGSNAGIVASGRIQGQAGINATDYAIMSQLLSLGETSTTAYRGDRGKTAYDHSQLTSGTNPHNTTFANIASLPTTISGFGIADGVSNLGNRSIAGLTTLGSSSIAPTHTVTIPSVGTGFAHYNTVDQVTNYERVLGSWISNVYTIATGIGGTGTARALRLNAGVGSLTIGGTSSLGLMNFGASASTANISWVGVSGTMSATTGTQNGLSLFQTVNQSSTAGYRMVWISPFEQSLGSNPKYLIDAGTNSAASGGGTHTSRFTVDNAGNTTANSFVKSGGTAAQFLKADGSVDAGVYALSSKFITASSPTLTFGEIPAHSFIDLGLDVTGAAFGDVVTLGIPNAVFVNGAMFNAMVSNDSPGVVTIRCANITASPITIPGGVYKVTIIK